MIDKERNNLVKKKDLLSNLFQSFTQSKEVSPIKISLKKVPSDKSIIDEIEELIEIIKIPKKERLLGNLEVIYKYLEKTDITKKIFRETSNDPMKYAKTLFYIAFNISHEKLMRNEFVFREGDPGDKFYIILKGKINVIKCVTEQRKMNSSSYYKFLKELKDKGATDLFFKTIKSNEEVFPINKKDLDSFGLDGIIFKFNLRKEIRNGLEIIHIKNKLKNFNQNPKHKKIEMSVDIDPNKYYTQEETRKMFLKSNREGINLNIYNYLDMSEEMEVTLYKYDYVVTLENGRYFGDMALDNENGVRTCPCQASVETHLGVIDSNIYKKYIYSEKYKFIEKEIEFLLSNYFLKHIQFKVFKKNYFKLFKILNFSRKTLILNQDEVLSCVYFIKNGSVSISLSVTLSELIHLQEKLAGLLRVKMDKTPFEQRFINERYDETLMNKKKTFKVSFLNVSLL